MRPGTRSAMLALLAAAVAAAGCMGPGPDENRGEDAGGGGAPDATYAVGGSFTENATQDDLEAVRAEVEALGGELLVMESFPMQYQATGLIEAACAEARAFLQAKEYVAEVGECRDATSSADPDAPVNDGGPAA